VPIKLAATIAGSLACFALAAGLFLLAVDVTRWRAALDDGDVRYRVAPGEAHLWDASTVVPFGTARGLLGIEDDLEFRRAVRALRLGRLEDATVSDPDLAVLRSEAQARLTEIADGGGDRARRSKAANLLGVLGLARLVAEPQNRAAILEGAIATLQRAIVLDPANGEAKHNLELALQRGSGARVAEGAGGQGASPGGSGAKGAGAGEPGSGY
jgi:hypothetical protein